MWMKNGVKIGKRFSGGSALVGAILSFFAAGCGSEKISSSSPGVPTPTPALQETIAPIGEATPIPDSPDAPVSPPPLHAAEIALLIPSGAAFRTAHASLTFVGTCSREPLVLTSSVPGTFLNGCLASGRFTFEFTLQGTMNVVLTATPLQGEAGVAQVTATLDTSAPTLAITSPALGANALGPFVTDAATVTLSGSCSTDVVSLTVSPSVAFADSNCSDGTWSLSPKTLEVGAFPFLVRATNGAGTSVEARLNVVKILVLGQPAPSRQLGLERGISGPYGVWSDGTKLAVADDLNNRVLIWNSLPATSGTAPDIVLGQPDLSQNLANNGGISARSLSTPRGVWSDGTRFVVADMGNNRVLVWNAFPTQNDAPANMVLGQPHMGSNAANAGGLSASSLYWPQSAWSDGTKLVVSDFQNQRVLIWNTFPASHGAAADVVLGQQSFFENIVNNGGLSGSSLYGPVGLSGCAGKLMVTDSYNQRLLIWNAIPTVSGTSADVALGPSSLTASTVVNPVAPGNVWATEGVFCDGNRLFLSDRLHNRVLVWNTVPTVSGASADLVLGQPSLTSDMPNSGGLSAKSIYYPHGISGTASRVFVADRNNGRILSWPTTALASFAEADLVFGAPDGSKGVSVSGLSLPVYQPSGGIKVGTKLILADSGRNRVLIWNAEPANNSVTPDLVLGQPDLFQSLANNGGVSAQSLSAPWAVWSDGTRLLVVDKGNHRVLVWNSFPTSSFAPADFVLGQTSFSAAGTGLSSSRMNAPRGIASDGTRLFVSDTGNNRILFWSAFPTTTGEAASGSLGQNVLTSSTANFGGLSAKSLSSPGGIIISGSKFMAADTNNHRVLIWNSLPSASYLDADVVLGQPLFTTNATNNGGLRSRTLNAPSGVASNGAQMAVTDATNHRVLVWNSIPASNFAPADVVIGQASFSANTASSAAYSGSPQGLNSPQGLWFESGRLWVANTTGGDVKLWNALPVQNWAPADVTLGTTSAKTITPFVGSSTLRNPTRAIRVGQKLIVADSSNNRILIWNSFPVSSGVAADVVLGQPDMQSSVPNSGGLSARSLDFPIDVSSQGSDLWIADSNNHRVLVYRTIPTTHFAAADFVLGQPDFTTNMANSGGIGARSLNLPSKVFVGNGSVYVAERGNHRVLKWSSIPNASYVAADNVIGQSSFFANSPNNNGVGPDTLMWPDGVLESDGRLFVTDYRNNRVLVWNASPSANGVPADFVLGQPNLYTNSGNGTTTNGQSLSAPAGLAVWQNKLFVSDSGGNRVLVYPSIPAQDGAAAEGVIGQQNLYTNVFNTVLEPAFRYPQTPFVDGNVLLAPSYANDRVLILPSTGLENSGE